MKITLQEYMELEGVEPLTDVDYITQGCRVFYELGHCGKIIHRKHIPDEVLKHEDGSTTIIRPGYKEVEREWIREGLFVEFKDKNILIRDERMKDPGYLAHHNFVILPGKYDKINRRFAI